MARILTAALTQVKAQLDHRLPPALIGQLCRELGYRWRQRHLDPATTVYVVLLQLLAGVALAGLRHVAQLPLSAQAFCKARMRLPLQLWMRLVEYSARGAEPAPADADLWKGRPLILVDGTSFETADTPPLARRYGHGKNQRGTSQAFPIPKLLCALDRYSGRLLKVIALPWSRQEATCLHRLFKALADKSLLLADRAFAGFAQLALLLEEARDLAALFQLPRGQVVGDPRCKVRHGRKTRRGRQARRRRQRLGKQDLLVQWERQALRRPGWLSLRRWQALPQQLTLRQIAFRITRKGHRTQWAWLLTTLTDPKQYPAGELVQLYGQRWQVEVCFRDLKQSLGCRHLSARTVDGVRKQLLALVLLYNLVRGVMSQAAQQQGVEPDRISFIDAMRWLLWSSPGQALERLVVNPSRPRATQPRRLKHSRHRYPQLNGPRQSLVKPACEAKL
jgi:hypothetical protein